MEIVKWKMDNFDGSSVDTSKFHINNLKIYAPGRVAEVGRLSANTKNAFNSFVGRIFANSRQKTFFFASITKIATKQVIFAGICKYMGNTVLIFLNAKLNKSFEIGNKCQYRDKMTYVRV